MRNGRSPNHVNSGLRRAPRHYAYKNDQDSEPSCRSSCFADLCCRNRRNGGERGGDDDDDSGVSHLCKLKECGAYHGPVCSANDDPLTDSPYLWNDLYSLEEGMECSACITRLPHITRREVLRAIGKIDTKQKGPNVLGSRHVQLPINALWFAHGFFNRFLKQLAFNFLFISSNCVFSVWVRPGGHHRGVWKWFIMLFLVVLAFYHGHHEYIQLRAEIRRAMERFVEQSPNNAKRDRADSDDSGDEADQHGDGGVHETEDPQEAFSYAAYWHGICQYFASGWNWIQLLCVFGSLASVVLVRTRVRKKGLFELILKRRVRVPRRRC